MRHLLYSVVGRLLGQGRSLVLSMLSMSWVQWGQGLSAWEWEPNPMGGPVGKDLLRGRVVLGKGSWGLRLLTCAFPAVHLLQAAAGEGKAN